MKRGESVSKQLFQGVLFKKAADWETRRKDFLKNRDKDHVSSQKEKPRMQEKAARQLYS